MGKLTYDAISEMSYLKAVVKETLRLYCPFMRLVRKCSENYQLGSIFLKKGTLVGVPIYCIHHDAKYWPDPETFDPERFMGDPNDINPYTYLPFGVGRRNCVAKRFAEMEVKFAISVLLSKVRLYKLPTTEVIKCVARPISSGRPNGGLNVPPKFTKSGLMTPVSMILGVETR
ncbi:Cytochrome P450 9e2 [Nymphon striatum]|nr:Cytochrome P450 9e2 [Nymphon striatum]